VVRLAGVHAMAGLSDDWQENQKNRQTCVDALCAYLRLPYNPDPGDDADPTERTAYRANREVRHTIIRVITAHLQDGAALSWPGLNLDFTGMVFDGGDFRCAKFSSGTVNFTRAKFSGGEIDFGYAEFSGGAVSFRDAEFSTAQSTPPAANSWPTSLATAVNIAAGGAPRAISVAPPAAARPAPATAEPIPAPRAAAGPPALPRPPP
jgi:hypothetical protein